MADSLQDLYGLLCVIARGLAGQDGVRLFKPTFSILPQDILSHPFEFLRSLFFDGHFVDTPLKGAFLIPYNLLFCIAYLVGPLGLEPRTKGL